MKGSAERPGDAHRDPGPQPGRAPESASFEVVRVGTRGRFSPFAVAAFAAVLMGMVGIAVGSRLTPPPVIVPPVAVAATSSATAHVVPPIPAPSPVHSHIPTAPVQTSDPGSTRIRLEVQRLPGAVSVHGDVYVAKVTWVFISLRDPSGTVTGWSSVSVPGAAGPGVRGGPTMRFDVELPVPDGSTDAFIIQATAYDGTGKVIGSTQLITPGA